MSESRYDEFVDSLKELPLSVWKATPCESISWKLLKPFSKSWEFGHFASLFVALGLNDYATIGKAEVGYWPRIVPNISPYIDPANPLELIDVLRPLFTNERLGQKKVKRLEMFARSALCSRVWGSSAPAIASEFTDIRIQLGKTMNQKPTDETIALAIKCLAFALLMVDEFSFDYGAIPVPVDSRIRCLSARLGLPNADEDTERRRWAEALRRIRERTPQITMLHLDTLLWHIANKHRSGIEVYLADDLGVESVIAKRISKRLGHVPASFDNA